MKSRWMFVLCLLALMCVPVFAQQPGQEKPPAGMPPMDSPEMQAMMAAMSPGPEHKNLAKMTGDWTFTNKMWMDPSAPPAEGSGTMHAETILGGRYVHAVWKGNFMGMPFEGHGTEGYDNLTKKYVSSWVDNMSTAIMYSTGTCEQNGKVCTATSQEMLDPMSGKMTSFRSVVTWTSDTSFKMEMYSKPAGGAEMKGMEMTVTKK
ncbi:MAG TPA: DUF1579 domain-containing protein [Candidatus Eisenbacteria bacterium]|nr:DUF1579 domain-containing protein [Candidatus Eisenbacteria bacterium]